MIERESLPDCLEITAWTDDGEIMGVRHKTLAVEGVQFHPESILTEHGHAMLANFPEGAGVMQHKDLLDAGRSSATICRTTRCWRRCAQMMSGEWTPAQIAGFLIALRMKGETVAEIAAAAEVMRELSTKVPLARRRHLVDTCGTGGDGAHTFNISTASAFVAAACGARVAKHGGRSVSSTSGSADVLEALGVNVNLAPEKVAEAVKTIGVGFMFAPNHHSAMKHAAPVRRELGVRTLFNLLGPLTNPAGAPNQVMGVFSRDLTGIAGAGAADAGQPSCAGGPCRRRAGRDQPGFAHLTWRELKDGHVSEYELEPGLFGLPQVAASEMVVKGKDEAVEMLLAALENRHARRRRHRRAQRGRGDLRRRPRRQPDGGCRAGAAGDRQLRRARHCSN